ncbi:hypothetical protein, partial [Pseudomonas aeruginosa]|uniref:hypothetical protein n=2 Tax=Pseudomonas TaxID=286 RepID=UPI0019D26048
RLFLGTEQSIDRATDQHWISITEETTTMSRHEDLLLQLIQREPDKIRSILGLPAPKPDLSWYEGADVWIEAGHRSDRGAEHRASKGIDEHLLVAMADPKVIAAIIQAARIKRFAKIAPLNTQEWAAETERMKAQFSSPAAEESTTPDTLQYIGFSGPQRALLDQLAQYWLRIAAVSKREAEANPNPDRKRGLELRYMAHYNCAAELQNLLQTGELPGHLGFQVLAQKPE